MNIAQTRQVLTYLWATHPSAGKLDEDSKTAIIASYFRILYRFDINDVLEAVDRVCRESVTFIPSAYEIEKRCTKNVDVSAYLSREYEMVSERLEESEAQRLAYEPEYDRAFKQRTELLSGQIFSFMSDEQKDELAAKTAPLEAAMDKYYELSAECQRLKDRRDELYYRAEWEAYDAYDRAQAQMAHKDLCSLGYERLAQKDRQKSLFDNAK